MVLEPELRFDGFTHADWQRLLELFTPPSLGQPSQPSQPATRAGARAQPVALVHDGLIAVRRGDRLVKLVHTHHGRLPIRPQDHARAVRAADLAQCHGTRWAIRIDMGALERIMDALGGEARQSDRLTEQLGALLDVGHLELARGAIDVGWTSTRPAWLGDAALSVARTGTAGRVLQGVARGLEWAAKLLCPPRRTVMLATFSAARLVTCVVLSRGAREIEAVHGPAPFRDQLGQLSGELPSDHRALRGLVEATVGELFVACSAQHETLQAIVSSASWGRLSHALSTAEVVIEPRPTTLAVPLALDAAMGRVASFGR